MVIRVQSETPFTNLTDNTNLSVLFCLFLRILEISKSDFVETIKIHLFLKGLLQVRTSNNVAQSGTGIIRQKTAIKMPSLMPNRKGLIPISADDSNTALADVIRFPCSIFYLLGEQLWLLEIYFEKSPFTITKIKSFLFFAKTQLNRVLNSIFLIEDAFVGGSLAV